MTVNVMVDLETMSTRADAAICSIGAVKFEGKKILDTFYCTIDIKTCKEAGLRISKDTVEWWSKQNKEAFKELTKNNISLEEALDKFAQWIGPKSLLVWGNGAVFDNTILANAYFAIDKKPPWSCWDDRCYRTVKNLFHWIPAGERKGTYHNALDDALYQTEHLIKILGD
jgi:DNA polymerase III epsilon subunit-like protein